MTEGRRDLFYKKLHCKSLGWITHWERSGEGGGVWESRGGGAPSSCGCQAFRYIPALGHATPRSGCTASG